MAFVPMPLDPVQASDQATGGLPVISVGPKKIGTDLYAWAMPERHLWVLPFAGSFPNGLNVYRSQDNGMTWFSIDGDNSPPNSGCSPFVLFDRLVIAANLDNTNPVKFVDFRFSNAGVGPNTFSAAYGTVGGPITGGSMQVLVLSTGDIVVVYDSAGSNVRWARFSGGVWTTINNLVVANSSFEGACVDASDKIHIIVQNITTSVWSYFRWVAGAITAGPIAFPGAADFLAAGNLTVIGTDLYIAVWGHGANPTERPGVLIGSPAASFVSLTLEEADTDPTDASQFCWVWEDGAKPNLIWMDGNGSPPGSSMFKSVRTAGVWSAKAEIFNATTGKPYTPLFNSESPALKFLNATPDGYIVEMNVQCNGTVGLKYFEFFLFTPPVATAATAWKSYIS